ncbi:MAG: hybrid sensor histidine kinase/response regulator [Pseudomonadota bacterium]|nr:hybrid sensor histidine kinase/response regulator [Pseudomonadota bacterium]
MNESPSIGMADLRLGEALRFVVANTLQSVMASTLLAVLLVILLRASISLWPALIWLFALVCVGAVRVRLRLSVARFTPNAATKRRYLEHFSACALATGGIWACAPWMLSTGGDRTLQSVVLLACAAIATGGAFASLASLRTAFAIFWPPMLAPVLFGLLNTSQLYLIVAGVAVVLSLVLSRMLLVLNHQFVEQVDLRQRNAELLLALQQRTADAEAANEAKTRFLVAASHDLRQPMHAIAIRTRALLEQSLPPDAHAVAVRLDRSVVAMQSLFDALLDISKLDGGAIQPLIVPFSLNTLFEKLTESYADISVQQGVSLNVEETQLGVASDVVLLERILRQLLDNAMRHAANSSVSVQARLIGDEVVIAVRDTGKGIAHDQQVTIFKEFVQLDNPERDRRKGLGLGLAIVERVARELGHRLELESTPGQGACFRIVVPAAPLEPSIETAQTTRAPVKVLPVQDLVIALLDDDPDVLEAMSLLLTRWKFKVIAATQSADLEIDLSRQDAPPDLLICDYRLAEKRNGRQVINDLRRHYGRELPALLITGDIRAIEVAGDGQDITVLLKPIAPEILRDMIVTHLAGSTAR